MEENDRNPAKSVEKGRLNERHAEAEEATS